MMLKSYIKSGVRSFLANKVSSFINVVGLASTVSIAIAVYLIIDRQMHLDQFHEGHERIYMIQSVIQWDQNAETWSRSPQLLGKTLEGSLPQIEYMSRVQVKSALIRYGDDIFSERLSFADNDFLDLFNFPLSAGNTQSLKQRNNIIIAADVAVKYFGKEDPMGKYLQVVVNDEVHQFMISGVAEKLPETASFGFKFLLSIDNLSTMFKNDLNTWTDIRQSSLFTFIKLDHPKNLQLVKETTNSYLSVINEANPDWPITKFHFSPLTTTARNSQYTIGCLPCGSTPEVLVMFGIISLILFVSACFNYINIAIASSSKRLKEIAMRKVIGGTRSKIIFQFIVENLVLSFFCVVVGIILAQSVIIPGMNAIFGGDTITLDFTENLRLIYFIVLLFLIVGIASGAYPAYYISSFKPLDIFKGKEKIAGKGSLTKLFLTFQFFLTFIAVVSGLIFTQTNKSQEKQDWGYDQSDLLIVPVKDQAQFNSLSQFTTQLSDVSAQSGSYSQIGQSKITEAVEINSKKTTVDVFEVHETYMKTMGLVMKSGSFFNVNLHGDLNNKIIVNEELIRKFGWNEEEYELQELKIGNEKYQVVGIVRDFHHNDFFEPIAASAFKITANENFRYLTLKTNEGELDQVAADVKSYWNRNFPNELYRGYKQEEAFEVFFQQTGQLIDVMNFTSIMAIILSSMGLFGLVSLLIVKRIKELSIRNVLGATQIDNARLVAKQFVFMLGISLILALPTSYFLFDALLAEMFLGSPPSLTSGPFIVALLIILMTIILTVSFHLNQLIRTNPVDNLRTE